MVVFFLDNLVALKRAVGVFGVEGWKLLLLGGLLGRGLLSRGFLDSGLLGSLLGRGFLGLLDLGGLEGAGVAFGGDKFAAGNTAFQCQVELSVGGFGILDLKVGEDVLLDGDFGAALLVSQTDDGLDDHLPIRRMSRGFPWLGGLLSRRGSSGFRHFECSSD